MGKSVWELLEEEKQKEEGASPLPEGTSLEVSGTAGAIGGGSAAAAPSAEASLTPSEKVASSAAAADAGVNPDNPNYDPSMPTQEGWDIVRDPTLEAVSTYDREHFGETPELSGTGLTSEDFEQYGDHGSTSQGMTYDEFVAEWNASGVDRAPTQQEYENWIQWGDPGKLAAELSGSTSTIKAEDGSIIPVYTEESLQYAIDNEIELDWLTDGSLVVFPNSEEVQSLLPERYHTVDTDTGFEDQFTLYFKQEKADWYEDPWVVAALAVAATLLTGVGASAVLGSSGAGIGAGTAAATGSLTAGAVVEGAAVGAISGAAGGATSALLTGQDVWNAIGEGALQGAVLGGVGNISGLNPAEVAVSKFLGAGTVDLILGADVGEALGTATAAGFGGYVGEKLPGFKGIAGEAMTKAGVKFAFGADVEEALLSGTQSLVSGLGSRELSRAINTPPQTERPVIQEIDFNDDFSDVLQMSPEDFSDV